MAFTLANPPFGGESGDSAAEMLTYVRTSDCTVDTTAAGIQTGTNCVKVPLGTNAAKAIIPAFGSQADIVSNKILVFPKYVRLSGSFTTEAGLISNATQGGTRWVRVGTDGLIRFYDSAGVQVGPDSLTALGTTGKEIVIVYDFLSLGTGALTDAMIHLFVSGKWELSFVATTTGVLMESNVSTITVGEWMSAGNRGADMYIDDLVPRGSTTGADAPHLLPFMRPRVVGGKNLPPTSEGNYHAWAAITASPNTWQDVDEYPNDGATTNINTNNTSQSHTFHYSAANPVPSGAAVDAVDVRVPEKIASAGKTGCDILMRLAGVDATTAMASTPGTAFVGLAEISRVVKPGGDGTGRDWVQSDFDLITGTATATDHTSMTDSGVTFEGMIGATVTMGGRTLVITSLTGTTKLNGSAGWVAADPAAGAYSINASKVQCGVQSSAVATAGPQISNIGMEIVYSQSDNEPGWYPGRQTYMGCGVF